MRTKSFLLIATLALVSTTAFSQREETVLGHRGFRFSGLWGGTNHQITRFGHTNSYMHGGFFGLEFGKTLLVGFSAYELDEKVDWDNFSDQDFKMRFRGLNLGYKFNAHRAIHPVINLDLSPGKVELKSDGLNDRIFVVQPGAGIEINVLRWFHLGLNGGYRFVTDTNIAGLNDEDLSGAFGQVSLRFGFSWGKSRNRYHHDSDRHKKDND